MIKEFKAKVIKKKNGNKDSFIQEKSDYVNEKKIAETGAFALESEKKHESREDTETDSDMPSMISDSVKFCLFVCLCVCLCVWG